MYVVGDTPTIQPLSVYISAQWKDVAKPDIFYHDDGYFLVKFQKPHDCNAVLRGGPYTMGGRPVIVKRWTEKLDFHKVVDLLTC